MEHDGNFYDAHNSAVFGVATDVLDLFANVTDSKPPGNSTAW
jgi:hypothetical protein